MRYKKSIKNNRVIKYDDPADFCREFIWFVQFYNKFINHQKKDRKTFIEKEMRL